MTPKTVDDELEGLFNTYVDRVEELAARVRERLLVPFCQKHDLIFVSGMGSWGFWARKSPDDDEYSQQLMEATEHQGDDYSYDERSLGYLHSGMETKRYRCKRLLEILNRAPEGLPSNDFGSMMESYDTRGGG